MAHWANVRFSQCYHCDGLAFARNKLHFKGFAIFIAVNNSANVATPETICL